LKKRRSRRLPPQPSARREWRAFFDAASLAIRATIADPAVSGYTTLGFKISFVRGMSGTSGAIRTTF
jgi:hypothetical protein